jgi:hypothetical protein
MKKTMCLAVMLLSILLIAPFGCRDASNKGQDQSDSESEEPNVRLKVDETYDTIRKGVRLILAYDSVSSAFIGSVENVTDQTIPAVRVEVHLSNGTELGPTPRNNLEPGRKTVINLSAEGQTFDWWKAHAETGEGAGEHGHEHGGEHAEEHEHEHGEEHGAEHR